MIEKVRKYCFITNVKSPWKVANKFWLQVCNNLNYDSESESIFLLSSVKLCLVNTVYCWNAVYCWNTYLCNPKQGSKQPL